MHEAAWDWCLGLFELLLEGGGFGTYMVHRVGAHCLDSIRLKAKGTVSCFPQHDLISERHS